MTRAFVDTNIFLEVFARKGEKSDRCLSFLESQKGLWTTSMVFSEVEWVLRSAYNLPKPAIIQCLRFMLSKKSISILHRNDLVEAVQLYESFSMDFTDCIHALECKRNHASKIYSYDHHFDRFSWVKRIEP